jgi:isoquinoline 1-oxidoreductase alpha subunit
MTDFILNRTRTTVNSSPEEPLLWVLRDALGLTGTKFGCGAGFCGSCTVHVDGVATRSCITPLGSVAGRAVTTIEGLAEGDRLHPVQQAFLDLQVPQCAWCMSGQMMTAAALLANNPAASVEEQIAGMNANYCRCGCYARIRAAVAQAADAMRGQA